MTKPIYEINVVTTDERKSAVSAVFDTGAFFSIIREDRVPRGAAISRYTTPHSLGTAAKKSKLKITGEIPLVMVIGDKMISDTVLVAPKLGREMLIGAKTMQSWDITIGNKNGKTKIHISHDIRDPDINEVLLFLNFA